MQFYWKAKESHSQLPVYISKFLPELSEGADLIMQLDIRDFNLQHIYTLEYIKGICKYLLPFGKICVEIIKIRLSCVKF